MIAKFYIRVNINKKIQVWNKVAIIKTISLLTLKAAAAFISRLTSGCRSRWVWFIGGNCRWVAEYRYGWGELHIYGNRKQSFFLIFELRLGSLHQKRCIFTLSTSLLNIFCRITSRLFHLFSLDHPKKEKERKPVFIAVFTF